MMRTTSRSVRFRNPFILTGLKGEQPAGVCEVETDEVALSGLVYRRIETRIIIPLRETGASGHQTVPINPDELESALAMD